MKTELRHNLSCVGQENAPSYGGNQMRSSNKVFQAVGCGVIASQELLIYLCRYHGGLGSKRICALSQQETATEEEYDSDALYLAGRYLPLIPGFGINGVSLIMGLNLYFRIHKMPFYALWGVSGSGFLGGIQNQLARDIPVILSIGPNFPRIWAGHNLNLYSKTADGRYYLATKTRSHYIIACAIDDEWIRISSWGKKYYINIAEYKEYVSKNSSYIVSNYVKIRSI